MFFDRFFSSTKQHRLQMSHRTSQISLSVAVSLLALTSCMSSGGSAPETAGVGASQPQSQSPAASPSWQSDMQSLSKILSDLLPLIASQARFADPAAQARIETQLNSLKKLSHNLKSEKLPPNTDPSMKMISTLFNEDLTRASENLKLGHTEFARKILRDTTSYCIQCHTQTNNGPSFPQLDLKADISDLSVLEKAQFYASTRQFDSALAQYQLIIKDKTFAQEHAFEWNRAGRSALAIAVKVKNDAHLSEQLAKLIEKNANAPVGVKNAVKAWLGDISQWKKESTKVLQDPAHQINQARQWVQKAQRKQKYPLDHEPDILYFRASSLLHDFMSHNPEHPEMAEALYLSGIASESTRDMEFWTLFETYYELCIKKAPHSPLAQKCFQVLQTSITSGYTGSSGTHVPLEEQKRLSQLRTLADPELKK